MIKTIWTFTLALSLFFMASANAEAPKVFSSSSEAQQKTAQPKPMDKSTYAKELDQFLKQNKNIRIQPASFNSNSYFTLTDEFEVVGPRLNFTEKKEIIDIAKSQEDYYKKVFRAIVKSADKYAKETYIEGRNDNFSYYSFMVLALTTPHHESKLMQFRDVMTNACTEDINNLEYYYNFAKTCRQYSYIRNTLGIGSKDRARCDQLGRLINQGYCGKTSSFKKQCQTDSKSNPNCNVAHQLSKACSFKRQLSKTGNVIRDNYKTPYNNLIPKCSELAPNSPHTQFMTSGSLMDFGIMQINIKSHSDDFMHPEDAFNLYNTIDNGIYYLWNKKGRGGAFSRLRSIYKRSKYTCEKPWISQPFRNTGGHKMVAKSFYNLIRGTWAGFYNAGAGTPQTICRFQRTSDPNYAFDLKFKKSLDSIVMSDSSFFHQFLPKDSDEYLALKEIVHNFRAIFVQPTIKTVNNKTTKIFIPEKNHFLRKVISGAHEDELKKVDTNYNNYTPTHRIKSNQIEVYAAPEKFTHKDETTKCGILKNPIKMSPFNILTVRDNFYNEKTGRTWAMIRVPRYSHMFYNQSSKYIKQNPKRLHIEPSIRTEAKGGNTLFSLNYSAEVRKQYPRLHVFEEKNNYYKVRIFNKDLWVHKINFVTDKSDHQDQTSIQQFCGNEQYYYVEANQLEPISTDVIGEAVAKNGYYKIKRYPDLNSPDIANYYTAKNDEPLDIFDRIERNRSTWYKVSDGEVTGWIKESIIKPKIYKNIIAHDESVDPIGDAG